MNRNGWSRLLKRIIIGVLIVIGFGSQGFTKTTYTPLLFDNEQNIFSFRVQKSLKIMTIAISKNPDYIVYRFGTEDHIELEFPKEKKNSWSRFTYAWYLRGGGIQNAGLDLDYLRFVNNGYQYEVYSEYSAEGNGTDVGVRITNEKTNEIWTINGDASTVTGSLINFRDNSKIRDASLGN